MKVSLFSSPRTQSLACVAVFSGMVAAVTAQQHDPVPTRVKVESYGSASGTPEPSAAFQTRLDTNAIGESVIRVSAGWPGELAGLFLGRQPQALALPFNATLLVDPVQTLFGSFDRDGNFALPLDLADTTLIGSLYFQGLNYLVPGPGKPAVVVFQLTQGLKLTIVPGNEQPPQLPYAGPPLTATLVASQVPGDTFQLLNRIVVPSTGWDLRLEGVDARPGVTRVYLTLEAPNPNIGLLPVLETKRLRVDLGSPGERIEVHIQQVTRGVPSLPAFLLAAVIETSF